MLLSQKSTAQDKTLSHPGLRMHCRCNAAGKLWQRTDSTQEGSHVYTYGYDARGRLASVHKDDRLVERYTYNASGQSVTRWSPYTARSASAALELQYDAKGRLESDGKRGFGYDKHGSLSEIWDGDGQTRFTYKHSTVLDAVRFPNGTQICYEYEGAHPVRCYRYLTLCAEYQWDKEGRLVLFRDHDLALTMCFSYTVEGHAETVTLSRMAEAHAQTFPEDTDWKEQSRDWLHVASGMNRKKRIDGFLQGYTLPLRLRCACDQVGTLRVLTDPHGQVIKSVTRDSFGNLVDDSFPDLFVPLGFAGGLEDKYTGFTRFGWRDYDPVAGRFVCKDPAKDLRGDADLYDYCADDPVSRIDPTGLWTQETFDESRVSRDGQGQFNAGLGASSATLQVSTKQISIGDDTGGNSESSLVENLKVQTDTLKSDLHQRLSGKDSNIYKDTLEKLQAQIPDNATIEECELAVKLVVSCIQVLPATEWVMGNLWERMPEDLANEVAAIVFDEKVTDIVSRKGAQFVISSILKGLKRYMPIVGDLVFPSE